MENEYCVVLWNKDGKVLEELYSSWNICKVMKCFKEYIKSIREKYFTLSSNYDVWEKNFYRIGVTYDENVLVSACLNVEHGGASFMAGDYYVSFHSSEYYDDVPNLKDRLYCAYWFPQLFDGVDITYDSDISWTLMRKAHEKFKYVLDKVPALETAWKYHYNYHANELELRRTGSNLIATYDEHDDVFHFHSILLDVKAGDIAMWDAIEADEADYAG